MKMVRNLAGISVFCISLLLSSCGGNPNHIDSCGGSTSQWEYLITGYNASLVRYEKPIELGVTQTPKPLADNQFSEWSTFSIELKAAYQRYQANASPSLQFSLFAQAMACSPVLAGKQKVNKISIISAGDFNRQHPAGSELISLFESIDHPNINLNSLLLNSQAPLQLRLKLLAIPETPVHTFDIQITLNDGTFFLLKTGTVYFDLPSGF